MVNRFGVLGTNHEATANDKFMILAGSAYKCTQDCTTKDEKINFQTLKLTQRDLHNFLTKAVVSEKNVEGIIFV